MTTTATGTRARFTLDEDVARAWLAAGAAAGFMEHAEADNTLPNLEADWEATLDEHEAIEDLLAAARTRGILTPPHPFTRVHLEADSYGEGYRWLVIIDRDSGTDLRLASTFSSSPVIGDREARGAEAGFEVLLEAVVNANECLDDLEAYVASVTADPDDVACGQADETGEAATR